MVWTVGMRTPAYQESRHFESRYSTKQHMGPYTEQHGLPGKAYFTSLTEASHQWLVVE